MLLKTANGTDCINRNRPLKVKGSVRAAEMHSACILWGGRGCTRVPMQKWQNLMPCPEYWSKKTAGHSEVQSAGALVVKCCQAICTAAET